MRKGFRDVQGAPFGLPWQLCVVRFSLVWLAAHHYSWRANAPSTTLVEQDGGSDEAVCLSQRRAAGAVFDPLSLVVSPNNLVVERLQKVEPGVVWRCGEGGAGEEEPMQVWSSSNLALGGALAGSTTVVVGWFC